MINSPYATQLTRTGVQDFNSYKPYRTKAQKRMARESARRDPKTGTWKSSAPVTYHPVSEARLKGTP